MNFVIDLAHRGVSVAQWLEHRSAECEDLRFDSSWGLEFFSLSHARDKTKTSFSVYRFHFLLQRYYLVGLAVVSYPVSRDVSYATSDVCSHARGWEISNKCKDRSAVWARIDYICVRNDQILWYSSYLLYHQDCWFQSFLYNTFLSVGTRVMALSMKVLYSEKFIENKIINYN